MGTIIIFDYTPEFLRSAKKLSKRYKSFPEDLKSLRDEICKNPLVGTDLGGGLRKIRMAIQSKGKGKRGGARVITLAIALDESKSKMTFIFVYDKSEIANISDNKIKEILIDNGLLQS